MDVQYPVLDFFDEAVARRIRQMDVQYPGLEFFDEAVARRIRQMDENAESRTARS
jgi:hypothetical protein